MKKNVMIASLLAGGLVLSSCGLSNAVKGAGIGAGAGAIIGAGVGRVLGNTGLGAAIGGVVGGTAGTLIGNKMDKQKRELEEKMKTAKVESVNDGQAIRVTFDSGILFATNSASLSTSSQTELHNLAVSLKQNPDTEIKIVGHTDNTGSDKINDPLSLKRATSVQSFLAAQGVSSSRMQAIGEGSHSPVADNGTAAGRQANRRVEVYILPSKAMIEAAQAGTLK